MAKEHKKNNQYTPTPLTSLSWIQPRFKSLSYIQPKTMATYTPRVYNGNTNEISTPSTSYDDDKNKKDSSATDTTKTSPTILLVNDSTNVLQDSTKLNRVILEDNSPLVINDSVGKEGGKQC